MYLQNFILGVFLISINVTCIHDGGRAPIPGSTVVAGSITISLDFRSHYWLEMRRNPRESRKQVLGGQNYYKTRIIHTAHIYSSRKGFNFRKAVSGDGRGGGCLLGEIEPPVRV